MEKTKRRGWPTWFPTRWCAYPSIRAMANSSSHNSKQGLQQQQQLGEDSRKRRETENDEHGCTAMTWTHTVQPSGRTPCAELHVASRQTVPNCKCIELHVVCVLACVGLSCLPHLTRQERSAMYKALSSC